MNEENAKTEEGSKEKSEEKSKEKSEEEEFVYKAIKKKRKISPENAFNVVRKIVDIIGTTEFEAEKVEMLCSLIEYERLTVKKDEIYFTLSKGIKVHDDKPQITFRIREPDDSKLETAGIDIFKFGQQMAAGKLIDKETVKGLTYLTLGIDEPFASQIPPRDMMTVFSLYTLFFIGQ